MRHLNSGKFRNRKLRLIKELLKRKSVVEEKASRAGGIIAISGGGYPSWTSPKYGAMAREGYQKNPVVYRCIRMIAETAAMVPIRCFQGDTELLNHPLMDLLNRPNKDQSLPDLMESFYAYLQVAGNSYVEFVDGGEGCRELYVLRPDRMKIVPDNKGWPTAFEYTVNGRTARFNNAVGSTEVNPIFHMRLFHPQDDHYGQSPLQAASASVDIQNAANGWNKALFDNAARPSGALIYKGPDGAHLTEEQFHRLKTELENNYQGNRNAGRPLLLEGGLEWTPISLTPQDMDFIHAKHAAAREIALAFGVPPMLLGIPGDNSYANYVEANRAFWRQTILPLVDRSLRSISHWLSPAFEAEEGITLKCNLDGVTALSDERERMWQRIGKAKFLSVNEKRAALGYAPIEGGDDLELT